MTPHTRDRGVLTIPDRHDISSCWPGGPGQKPEQVQPGTTGDGEVVAGRVPGDAADRSGDP
jgi:hypothetical protein